MGGKKDVGIIPIMIVATAISLAVLLAIVAFRQPEPAGQVVLPTAITPPVQPPAIVKEYFTPSEVNAQKDSLLGKNITVRGVADVYALRCTLRDCAVPCCNECFGSLVLKDEDFNPLESPGQDVPPPDQNAIILLRGDYGGQEAGCFGNECEQTCYPLNEGGIYVATGTWEKENGGYFLRLAGFEHKGQKFVR